MHWIYLPPFWFVSTILVSSKIFLSELKLSLFIASNSFSEISCNGRTNWIEAKFGESKKRVSNMAEISEIVEPYKNRILKIIILIEPLPKQIAFNTFSASWSAFSGKNTIGQFNEFAIWRINLVLINRSNSFRIHFDWQLVNNKENFANCKFEIKSININL